MQPSRSAVSARAAVFGLFTSFGTLVGTWAVHLPTVQATLGVSKSTLGGLLLLLGVGTITGMQLTGFLVDRFGSGRVAVGAGALLALALIAPLSVKTVGSAVVAIFFLGVAAGIADVGMNAMAVEVERSYGRPIMAAFHAMFSVGNVFGSVIGAAGYQWKFTVLSVVLGVVVGCLVVVGGAARALIRWREDKPADVAPPQGGASSTAVVQRRFWRVLVLGVLTFLLFVCEGSAMDWSSLQAQQRLGASESLGSLAFGIFVAAMTIGRFSVDKIAALVGPVRVVRWGAVVASVGMVTVMAAPVLPLVLVGWVAYGLGLAGGVPQVFTAAGNLSGNSARVLSRVVGLGYTAMLAGPALIGWVADQSSLNTAFAIPLVAVLVCGCAASVVAPAQKPPHEPLA